MTKSEELQDMLFRLRGGIWTALFLVILVIAEPVRATVLWGLLFVVSGQLLRIWASGTIGLYRGEKVKAKELVTEGPYALMRNPLYFGNGLIGLGWSIMAGFYAILLFVLCFFMLYNVFIIPYEEKFLEKSFGDKFRQYKIRTARFYPRRLSSGNIAGKFDLSIVAKSEIHSLLVTVVGTLLLISRLYW